MLANRSQCHRSAAAPRLAGGRTDVGNEGRYGAAAYSAQQQVRTSRGVCRETARTAERAPIFIGTAVEPATARRTAWRKGGCAGEKVNKTAVIKNQQAAVEMLAKRQAVKVTVCGARQRRKPRATNQRRVGSTAVQTAGKPTSE